MQVRKWNYDKQDYEKYTIPGSWFCPLICIDMATEVNCAECGKVLLFGHTFTSLVIHSKMGFGYGVCPDCHEKEVQQEEEHRKRRL